MTVAVIPFPGSNCEDDACDALIELGIPVERMAWNTDASLDRFSGFILPGGFSYQDRVRAGVIAAKLPIIQRLKDAAVAGTPILGICNGAQILVESGFFSDDGELSHIIDMNYVDHQPIGFMCDWAYLQPFGVTNSVFFREMAPTDVLPVQVCHAEGRFLMQTMPLSGLTYCSMDGQCDATFPVTPNGSTRGLAGITNAAGNVLAMMPHPERSITPRRYPLSIRAVAERYGRQLIDFSRLFEAFRV